MAYAEKHTVAVTTDAAGAGEGFAPVVTGRIITIIYTKDATTPYADGVDFTITTEDSAQTVWDEDNVNASKTVSPRQATHSTAGVAALYAGGGTAVLDHVWAAQERIKIVVAQGGDTKTGQFVVMVG